MAFQQFVLTKAENAVAGFLFCMFQTVSRGNTVSLIRHLSMTIFSAMYAFHHKKYSTGGRWLLTKHPTDGVTIFGR